MNIYVGNLAFSVEEDELKDTFTEFGNVASVKIITDRFSGKSRGFGFIEMENKDDVEKAISEANGALLQGKAIIVNEARPQQNNRSREGQQNRGARW